MKSLLLVGGVILIVVGSAFLAGRNSEQVGVDLLLFSLNGIPLWGVLIGAFLLGGLLAGLALSWPLLRLRLKLRMQARQITRLEQEVHGLRTLPLPDEVSGVREG